MNFEFGWIHKLGAFLFFMGNEYKGKQRFCLEKIE